MIPLPPFFPSRRFSVIPLMYLPSSLSFSPPSFSFLTLFFSHVWCSRPAEDDLSGQSWYPFGRAGIIAMGWHTHLHAHEHGDMNAQTNRNHNTPESTATATVAVNKHRRDVRESVAQNIEGEREGFQMNQHRNKVDSTGADPYPGLYHNA